MSKKISTWVKIVAAVFVVAVIAIAGIFCYRHLKKKASYVPPTPVVHNQESSESAQLSDWPMPVKNDNYRITRDDFAEKTKNWKTYKNDQYGFEMKYPADFDVSDSNDQYFDSEDGHAVQISKCEHGGMAVDCSATLDIFFTNDSSQYQSTLDGFYSDAMKRQNDQKDEDNYPYYHETTKYVYRNFLGVKVQDLLKGESDVPYDLDETLDLLLKAEKGFYQFDWANTAGAYEYGDYLLPMLSTFKYEGNTPGDKSSSDNIRAEDIEYDLGNDCSLPQNVLDQRKALLGYLTMNINTVAPEKAPYERWVIDQVEFIDENNVYAYFYDTAETDDSAVDSIGDTESQLVLSAESQESGFKTKIIGDYYMGLPLKGKDPFTKKETATYGFDESGTWTGSGCKEKQGSVNLIHSIKQQ